MATSQSAKWTVIVVTDANETLIGTYQIAPHSKLLELMQIWKDDFELFGNWMFMSADELITYNDSSMTLEMIGETPPRSRIVTLRAKVIDELRTEIFVTLDEECHKFLVKANKRLYEVTRKLRGYPKLLQYDGAPLNPKHSIKQAKLPNGAIIYEPPLSITVKLSTGLTVIAQVPSNSLVLNLKENITAHETGEFSLKYNGRYLKSDERIRSLKDVVEVTTVKFFVHLNDRCIHWRTKGEPIAFPEFLSQLSSKAKVAIEDLEMLDFVCIGCQRHISHDKDFVQQLPIECCKEKSQTLNAVTSLNIGTNPESNDIATHIQKFHKHLDQYRLTNSRTEGTRCLCRTMKKKLAEEMLDYNVVAQRNEGLLKSLIELEERIKTMTIDFENLKIKNIECEREIERLQTTNIKDMMEIDTFKKTNMKLKIENEKLIKENMTLNDEYKKLDNKKLGDEIKKLDNKNLGDENKKLREENSKLMEDNIELFDELQPFRVKLLVFHCPSLTPVTRREIELREQYSWNQWAHIKCQAPGISAGATDLEQLTAVLGRLFDGPEIQMILQRRGSVAGGDIAEVTSQDEDEVVKDDKDKPFCDVDGVQLSSKKTGKPWWQRVRAGGRVFICGGGRRTVLWVSPS